MSGIKDDRTAKGAHDRQGAHIDHQIIVTKTCATFHQHDLLATSPTHFIDRVFHIPGGDELTFFDINGFAGFGGGGQ